MQTRTIEDRQPYIVGGRRIVSCTECLNISGVRRLVGYDEAAIAWRGMIGTAVHKATAFMDLNEVDWPSIPPDVREPWDALSPEVGHFSRSWTSCKMRERGRIRRVEYRVVARHSGLDFGMTLDREIIWNGQPWIWDLKTPKKKEPWWGVQLAGYVTGMVALHHMPAERPYYWQRAAVRLLPDDFSFPYRIIPYIEQGDFDAFTWALGLAVWNINHYPNVL
jgi:hypothetical protein